MAENWTTCKCNHCDGNLEFDVRHAGTAIFCPHCHLETTLFDPHADQKETDSGPGTVIGNCEHCKGKLRFNASKIGQIINCPHCGKHTSLFRAPRSPEQQPTDYGSHAPYEPYSVRSERPKSIEEKLDLLATIVLWFGILAAIACLMIGFNVDDAAVTEKAILIVVGWVLGFLGWVGMLFLNGFAEIIRLLRSKAKK